MIAKSYRWELSAVALAALLALSGSNAMALSLGRITVQSALGEPLSAEIDIADINVDEAASLKVQLASPANFKSAGLDYSPVLTGLRMALQKRADGRSYLRLSSDRLVQEPFVDLILDVGWQSGRLVRNYTLLFDPPNMRPAPAPAARPLSVPLAAPLSSPPPAAEPRVVQAPRPVAPTSPTVARQPAAAAEVKSVPPAPPAASSVHGEQRLVRVRPGDSASKIAMTHRLSNVSLDQMLVAMQRGNPNAFIEGNVNRIKAGAIVALPTEKQAIAVSPAQANQIITAQSQDFNRYRQALASGAGVTQQAPAERTVSGAIQGSVEDKKPASQAPDKLTLSKGSVQSATDLEQMALARNAEDNAKRAAQISQNTSELNQLAQTAASMAAAAASGTAAGAAASSVAAPALVPGVQQPVAPALPATAPVTAPASGFLDELLDNPLLPASAAALILLLAGLGFYKVRQRQKKVPADSSFMESSFQAESFFGDSGGQKVETQETAGTSSAMMYSASQLDGAQDSDPVAEADVYMAYGRDVQAEEVLKEALLKQPERVAIHQKLLAIYAKRQDAPAYAAMAALAHPLLKNNEPQWAEVCAAGMALEPGNPLYLAGGQPVAVVPASAAPDSPLPSFPTLPVLPTVAAAVAAVAPMAPVQPAETRDDSALDLDFDLDFSLDSAPPAKAPEPATVAPPAAPAPEAPAAASPAAPAAASAPLDMLEFDFDSLSLDLDDSDVVPTKQPPLAGADGLESKLALAEEFRANGDADGAKELIQQVLNEADGDLKARAQQALSQL
ncbi:FimV family protein [Rhodoferax sp.]|uniref:type IV pilus assembly protein FimV n=1 Tax=Rhodoferax sp. TaxID=50421 RepID=UPI002725B9DE|nr:FimV/HubP family polar landmark protein [Rhodoferax sp.]MDO9145107.1 FimV/HubP family polar landmark protein [Rhodoferax sp.]MDP3864546.1 FimV/HubP family polar landmark protein [Rhodoferax sp.]